MTTLRHGVLFILLLLSANLSFADCSGNKKDVTTNRGEVTLSQYVPLADPFILLYDTTYYAYGTHADNGIEVYYSSDLKKWKKHSSLALNTQDSYGGQWFWAPEVYYNPGNKKFYMYYSAHEHLCVALSDSPLGPFVQENKKPMIEDEKCIDSSFFLDDDGTPYLYFVRFNDGNNIWVAELENDLQTIKKGTMKKCINVSQNWEMVLGRVNEGPSIVKHDGIYYLTYSANDYRSQLYGIGYATASSPVGQWTKYVNNPVLQNPVDYLVGTGHGSVFTDKEGKLKYVFHAHYSTLEINPRTMHIAEVAFINNEMKIGGTIINPVIVK